MPHRRVAARTPKPANRSGHGRRNNGRSSTIRLVQDRGPQGPSRLATWPPHAHTHAQTRAMTMKRLTAPVCIRDRRAMRRRIGNGEYSEGWLCCFRHGAGHRCRQARMTAAGLCWAGGASPPPSGHSTYGFQRRIRHRSLGRQTLPLAGRNGEAIARPSLAWPRRRDGRLRASSHGKRVICTASGNRISWHPARR